MNGSGTDGIAILGRSLSQMFDLQRDLAGQLLRLVETGGDSLTRSLRSIGTAGTDECCGPARSSLTGSCCDIPDPCWVPKCLGEYECRLCPGSSATLRLRVTNDDLARREIHALASGAGAKQISFAPPSLALGPKERGTITAILAVPAEAKDGETVETIVWLRGCRDYYVRWTAKIGGSTGGCCAHELAVCDGPDHIRHWYDHFYCPRTCRNQVRQPG